ncbi:MAG: glutamine amidotransferase [Corynebacterium sp.]|nr:glutamine amidotransferase [Corynebacterium sp.]
MTFLLVSPRSGAEILAAEHRDFLVATGLDHLDQAVLDTADATLPDLSQYSGIFIGGSPFNMTSEQYSDWQLHVHRILGELIDAPLKVMFVCFGAGFATVYKGGQVARTHPESSGPTTVDLTEAGLHDPLTRTLPNHFTALTGHTENIEVPAQGSRVLATSPTCPVQILRVNETTWACQFHAEMDAIAMKNRMDFYFDYGYFAPEEYENIVKKLPSIDTRWAAQLLRNFIALCESDAA